MEARIKQEAAERCGLAEIQGQSLQSTLRRGWYYGPAEFRESLLEKGKAALSAKARRRPNYNYHGEEIVAHNEATAYRLLDEGLAQLGWDQARLEDEPKGHQGKIALAAAIRLQTTVPLAWLARRLHMGTSGQVSLRTRQHMLDLNKKHKLSS